MSIADAASGSHSVCPELPLDIWFDMLEDSGISTEEIRMLFEPMYVDDGMDHFHSATYGYSSFYDFLLAYWVEQTDGIGHGATCNIRSDAFVYGNGFMHLHPDEGDRGGILR